MSNPIVVFKTPVENISSLPLTGNNIGDARIALNVQHVYVWDGSIWINKGTTLQNAIVTNDVTLSDSSTGELPTEQAILTYLSGVSKYIANTVSFYFTNIDSDLTNVSSLNRTDLEMVITPSSTKNSIFSSYNTNGDVVIQSFATLVSVPGVTFFPAGPYVVHIHASEVGYRNVYLYGVINEVDASGNFIGTVGTSENTLVESGQNIQSVEVEYNLVFNNSNPYYLASSDSRLVVDIHAVFSSYFTSESTEIILYAGGEADSHISVPYQIIL